MARKKMIDKELRLQFLKTTTALITAAFGMVAALAWNSAISTAIQEFIGTSGSGILTMVIYALIVTVIAVLVTVYISRLSNKAQAEVNNEDGKTDDQRKREAWVAEFEEEKAKADYKAQWEAGQVK